MTDGHGDHDLDQSGAGCIDASTSLQRQPDQADRPVGRTRPRSIRNRPWPSSAADGERSPVGARTSRTASADGRSARGVRRTLAPTVGRELDRLDIAMHGRSGSGRRPVELGRPGCARTSICRRRMTATSSCASTRSTRFALGRPGDDHRRGATSTNDTTTMPATSGHAATLTAPAACTRTPGRSG